MSESFVFAGDQYVGEHISKLLAAAGFRVAQTVQQADAIFTYAVSQSQLEDMYFESAGLLEHATAGSCFIDLSPSTPTFARELYALAQTNNVEAIDAPVVVKRMLDHDAYSNPGALALLVGADDRAYDQFRPLLEAIASEVHRVGEPGDGQMAKIAQTISVASQLESLFEVHALSKKLGKDVSKAVSAGIGDDLLPAFAQDMYQAIATQHFHGTYTAQALMAELTAAMNACEESDMVLPQVEAVMRLVELFMIVGGSDMAVPAVSLVFDEDGQSSSKHGLDWSRAQNMYDNNGVPSYDSDEGDYDDYDEYDDDGEYPGGFGSYSPLKL